jgi:micrococcal nuclease
VGSDDFEWMELMNRNGQEVDLSGFKLDTGTSTSFALPPGTVLGPEQTLLLPRSLTRLSLPNGGGRVYLKDPLGTVIEEISYSSMTEGVSFGRSPESPLSLQSFCVPTPNAPNQVIPLDIAISLQSGETVGEGSITMNLQAVASNGTLGGASCMFDYGDGFVSQSCNPNSHSISRIGDNEVVLRLTDQCGITVEQTLAYHVIPRPFSSSLSHSSSSEEDTEDDVLPISLIATTTGLACPSEGMGIVHISEVLPDPDGSDDNEWIELWNSGGDTINVCGWQLDDSEGGSKPFGLDGISMNPKQYLVLPRSRTGLALNNTQESVRLLGPISGSNDHQVLETVSYEKSEAKKAYARKTDGSFMWTDLLSPGAANQFAAELAPLKATVTKVIDGDTIDVVLDEPSSLFGGKKSLGVRMIGIDTPETVHPKKSVQAYGIEASNFMQALLEGKKVELVFDTDLYDYYGRVLAYVQLSDGSLAQEKLLQEGLAFAYSKYPFSKKEAFLALEQQAKARKKNLWSDKEAQEYAEKQAMKEKKEITVNSSSASGAAAIHGMNSDEILLSEIYPHPRKKSGLNQGSLNLFEEWMEIQNTSTGRFDLQGWSLDDEQDGGSKPYVFPKDSFIEPLAFMIIPKSISKLSLNDDKDSVFLIQPDGTVAGALTYEKISEGVSMLFCDLFFGRYGLIERCASAFNLTGKSCLFGDMHLNIKINVWDKLGIGIQFAQIPHCISKHHVDTTILPLV